MKGRELLKDDRRWAAEHFGGEALDEGIIRLLRIFKESGIETCQSCEGPQGLHPEGLHGAGHCYRYPTIDIAYQPWAALDVANQYGVRVDQVAEIFGIREGRPVEHFWRVEFNSRQLAEFRRSWYGDAIEVSA